eukprot:1157312-Pelagomonas_calceolata.AAC.13
MSISPLLKCILLSICTSSAPGGCTTTFPGCPRAYPNPFHLACRLQCTASIHFLVVPSFPPGQEKQYEQDPPEPSQLGMDRKDVFQRLDMHRPPHVDKEEAEKRKARMASKDEKAP